MHPRIAIKKCAYLSTLHGTGDFVDYSAATLRILSRSLGCAVQTETYAVTVLE